MLATILGGLHGEAGCPQTGLMPPVEAVKSLALRGSQNGFKFSFRMSTSVVGNRQEKWRHVKSLLSSACFLSFLEL
jgi:hypothetical protein